MATFPSLTPSRRSFTLGQYPVKTYRALSGATIRRSFGNKPYGYTLDLEFQNIPQTTVELILAHYFAHGGTSLGFALPFTIFDGYNVLNQNLSLRTTGIATLINPAGTEWFYSEPPSITSVIKNISTVSIRLVAELQTNPATANTLLIPGFNYNGPFVGPLP